MLTLTCRIVAGASGVLGSATFNAFKQDMHDVKGLAYSRASDALVKVDLTNKDEVVALFEAYKPDCDYSFHSYQVSSLCPPNLRVILKSQGLFIAPQKDVQMWLKR